MAGLVTFRKNWQGVRNSSKFVQVAEMIWDTRVLRMDLFMTIHHATALVSSSSETIDFIAIWDYISSAEQEGSDGLFYTPVYVLQYVLRNLIITNRYLLEYVPRYVL
jgi:hypothetical protein